MSNEELLSTGGIIRGVEGDFTIGSKNMNVEGISEDDTSEPIMGNGKWAFTT